MFKDCYEHVDNTRLRAPLLNTQTKGIFDIHAHN